LVYCKGYNAVCLAPGGSLQQDAENSVTRCAVCVFSAADEPTVLKSYYEVSAHHHCHFNRIYPANSWFSP